MKNKLYSFIEVILATAGMVAGFILFGVLLFWLVLNCLLPTVFEFFPDLADRYEQLSETELYTLYRTTYQISALIALFPSSILVNTLQKRRNDIFIKETRGLIPKKEGLRFHVERYRLSDLVTIILIAVICLCMAITKSMATPALPFDLFYDHWGILPGFVLSLLLLLIAQLVGVLSAQSRWRADYFCDDL